jgi:hypothetical protein
MQSYSFISHSHLPSPSPSNSYIYRHVEGGSDELRDATIKFAPEGNLIVGSQVGKGKRRALLLVADTFSFALISIRRDKTHSAIKYTLLTALQAGKQKRHLCVTSWKRVMIGLDSV